LAGATLKSASGARLSALLKTGGTADNYEEGTLMNAPELSALLQSPLLAKLFLHLISLALLLYLRRKDTEGIVTGVLGAVLILFVRDALLVFFKLPEIFYVADVFVYGMFTIVAAIPFGKRLFLSISIAYNLLVVALYTAQTFAGFLPFSTGHYIWVLLLLPNPVAFAVYAFLKREEQDTASQVTVKRLSVAVPVWLTAYIIASVFLSSVQPYFDSLVIPAFYCVFVFFIAAFVDTLNKQMVQACAYYEESVDSLYNLFIGTGAALKSNFEVEDVLRNMLQAVVNEVRASGGIVFLVDEFDDVINVKSYFGKFPPPFQLPDNLPKKPTRVESYMKHLQLKVGETLFGQAAQSGQPLFIADAANDPSIFINGIDESLALSSLIVVPLMLEDKIIGVLGVSKNKKGDFFSEIDFDRVKMMANFGTLAVNNVFSFLEASEKSDIEREAAMAAEIQKTLMLKKLPDYGTVSFGSFTSSARGVCGDYFDILQVRKNRVIVAIADVAGKGVAASLVMVMIRSILHLVANSDKSISTVLSWINRGITGKIDMDHYATMALLDIDISNGRVTYTNANQQPVVVYRSETDALETVEIKSIPIGVERQTSYEQRELSLKDGDVVVLYTDGIVEAMNEQGKQYGRKNLGTIIHKYHGLPAKEIANKIKGDLQAFVGQSRQHDDQTALVLKVKL
jgi:sigma-B regulation protein RsbU (phosphoserine phosphatase)